MFAFVAGGKIKGAVKFDCGSEGCVTFLVSRRVASPVALLTF